MNAGRLDKQVTFRRRAPGASQRDRGGYQDHATVWGDYRRLSGREALQAGREVNVEEGTLRIRIGEADDITIADRVVVEGRELGIKAVSTPDRRGGFVEFMVQSDARS